MIEPPHKYRIAERLSSPIAIVDEQGTIQWHNRAFEATFGEGAAAWLKEAARAVAGERGWLQGFFLADDGEPVSIDVEIAGRIFRADKIMPIDDYDSPAVALWC